ESGGPAGRNSRDNYSIVLEYGGISSVDCDINMSFTGTDGLAFCAVTAEGIATDHLRVTSANIEFGQAFTWFFNSSNTAPVLDVIADQNLIEGEVLVIPISAMDAEGDALAFSASGLPIFADLVDNNDGTATLTLSPVIGDASTNTMSVTVTDNGVPVLSDNKSFAIDVAVLDSDGDGLSDFDEINTYGTLPDNPDSDGDSFNDGVEVSNGSDPILDTSWPNFADGDIAPLGAPDGLINAADYLIAQRIVLGELEATPLELSHADLYPAGSPDGVINTSDLILLLKLLQ
ncbi:MAG: hypothetical protein GQ549_02715, partial [Gammaproteobacteria bacterium]|nr:hypothetical protein [Gammaproteobacteria bacterium]